MFRDKIIGKNTARLVGSDIFDIDGKINRRE
jgi:hypothetical protein